MRRRAGATRGNPTRSSFARSPCPLQPHGFARLWRGRRRGSRMVSLCSPALLTSQGCAADWGRHEESGEDLKANGNASRGQPWYRLYAKIGKLMISQHRKSTANSAEKNLHRCLPLGPSQEISRPSSRCYAGRRSSNDLRGTMDGGIPLRAISQAKCIR